MAILLGKFLADNDIRLVFGGGDMGLMGSVSKAVKLAGGEVLGVIPRHLRHESSVVCENDELIVVDSMHRRKQKMYDLADAFLVLPGGIGTIEEAFETWTWLQLGLHTKPIGLLNVENFFDELLAFLDTMFNGGFLKSNHRALLHVDSKIENLMQKLGYAGK